MNSGCDNIILPSFIKCRMSFRISCIYCDTPQNRIEVNNFCMWNLPFIEWSLTYSSRILGSNPSTLPNSVLPSSYTRTPSKSAFLYINRLTSSSLIINESHHILPSLWIDLNILPMVSILNLLFIATSFFCNNSGLCSLKFIASSSIS